MFKLRRLVLQLYDDELVGNMNMNEIIKTNRRLGHDAKRVINVPPITSRKIICQFYMNLRGCKYIARNHHSFQSSLIR
jgi:hypothetical protein